LWRLNWPGFFFRIFDGTKRGFGERGILYVSRDQRLDDARS